jgi:4'-phosphopantetheinyl transferase EntD
MLEYFLKSFPDKTQSYFSSQNHEIPLENSGLSFNNQYSPKRLAEFSSGRYCAIKALEQLGIKDVLIPIGEHRAPIWPEGIVGSISHCDSLTGAIVAKNSDHISLGLDIEEFGRVTPDLWDFVFTQNEKRYLSTLSEKEILVQSTAIFSIKEAFYKFQHPLTKIYLDFLDVEINIPQFDFVKIVSIEIEDFQIIEKNFIKLHTLNNSIIAIVYSKIKSNGSI